MQPVDVFFDLVFMLSSSSVAVLSILWSEAESDKSSQSDVGNLGQSTGFLQNPVENVLQVILVLVRKI